MSNNIDLDVNNLHRAAGNDAYEFPIWGTIVGDITNQDDLMALLNAKADADDVEGIHDELRNFIKWSELAGRIQLVSASQANEDNRFHATIQKGVDAAQEGDLVLIWDDVYNEPELFINKHNLSLVNIAPVEGKHGVKLVGDLSVQASGTYIKGFNITGKTMLASTGTQTLFDDCRLTGDVTVTGQGYIRINASFMERLDIRTNLYADVHVVGTTGTNGKRWELNSETSNMTLEGCYNCSINHTKSGKVLAYNCELRAVQPDGYNVVSTADDGHIFLINCSTRDHNAIRGKVNKTGSCDYQFSTLDFNRAESILNGTEVDPDFYITDYYTKEEIVTILSALNTQLSEKIQNLDIKFTQISDAFTARFDAFEAETEQKFEAERSFVESEVDRLDGRIDNLSEHVENESTRLDGRLDDLTTNVNEKVDEIHETIGHVRDELAQEVTTLNGKISDVDNRLTSEAARLDGRIDDHENEISEEVQRIDGKIDNLKIEISEEVQRLDDKDAELDLNIRTLSDSTDVRFGEVNQELADLEEKKVPWFDDHRILLDNHRNLLGYSTDGDDAFNLAMVSKWNIADFGSSKIPLNLNSRVTPTVQFPGETGEEAHPIALMDDVESLSESTAEAIQTVDDRITSEAGRLDGKIDDVKNVLSEKVQELAGDMSEEVQRLDDKIDNLNTEISEEVQRLDDKDDELDEKITTLSQSTDSRFNEVNQELADLEEKKVPWFDDHRILLDNHRNLLGYNADGNDAFNLAMVSKWDIADFGSSKIPLNLNSSVTPTVQFPGETGEEAHPIALMDDVEELRESTAEAIKEVDDRLTSEATRLEGEISDVKNVLSEKVQELADEMSEEVQRLDDKIDDLDEEVSGEVSRLDGRIDTLNTNLSGDVQGLSDRIDELSESTDDRFADVTSDLDDVVNAIGKPDGIAQLGSDGKIPATQLPSYVDEIHEFDTIDDFPAEGESNKIYIDATSNLTYRWTGTQYVEISPSIALGETSSTAFAGDRGKALEEEAERLDSVKANKADVYTQTEVNTELAKKQNNLTAGDNIEIVGDRISAKDMTFDDSEIRELIEGLTNDKANKADVYTQTEINSKLSAKQDTLTAGVNIKIEDNVISATDMVYNDTEIRDLIEGLESGKADKDSVYDKSTIDSALDGKVSLTGDEEIEGEKDFVGRLLYQGSEVLNKSSQWIPENSDLNDFRTVGFYVCPDIGVGDTIINSPTNQAFSLLVETSSGSGKKQTLTEWKYDGTAKTWFRNLYRQEGEEYISDWTPIWTGSNDGAGSGLDADLLDGKDSSEFVDLTSEQTISGNKNFTGDLRINGDGILYKKATVFDESELDNFQGFGIYGVMDENATNLPFGYGELVQYNLYTSSIPGEMGGWPYQMFFPAKKGDGPYVRNRVNDGDWSDWTPIWTGANGGEGSGLDADLLGGVKHDMFIARKTTENVNAAIEPGIYRTTSPDVDPNLPCGEKGRGYGTLFSGRGSVGDTGFQLYMGYSPTGDEYNGRLYYRGYNDASLVDGEIQIPWQRAMISNERPISENEDLNTYITTGFYRCPLTITATTLQNSPTNDAFSLIVEATTEGGCKQTLSEFYTENPRAWFRNLYNGVWGEWKEIITNLRHVYLGSKISPINNVRQTLSIVSDNINGSNLLMGSNGTLVWEMLCRDLDDASYPGYFTFYHQPKGSTSRQPIIDIKPDGTIFSQAKGDYFALAKQTPQFGTHKSIDLRYEIDLSDNIYDIRQESTGTDNFTIAGFTGAMDGMEYRISFYNNTNVTRTLTFPTGSNYQTDESEWVIEPQRIAELSISYVFGKYVLRVIGE